MSPAAIAEIDAALAGINGRPWETLTTAEIPLPGLGAELKDIAGELEDGCGVVKVTGLPVQRYSEAALRAAYFAIGAHLGTPVQQNGGRGLMRDIRDNSRNGGRRVVTCGIDAVEPPATGNRRHGRSI